MNELLEYAIWLKDKKEHSLSTYFDSIEAFREGTYICSCDHIIPLSRNCYECGQQSRITIKLCGNCGEPMRMQRSKLKHHVQYCNMECKKSHTFQKNTVEVICDWCKQTFRRHWTRLKPVAYCCKEHHRLATYK